MSFLSLSLSRKLPLLFQVPSAREVAFHHRVYPADVCYDDDEDVVDVGCRRQYVRTVLIYCTHAGKTTQKHIFHNFFFVSFAFAEGKIYTNTQAKILIASFPRLYNFLENFHTHCTLFPELVRHFVVKILIAAGIPL